MTTLTRLKVYRRHHCERQHRHHLSFARCVWKNAVWVLPYEAGTHLPYALVTDCRKPYLYGDQRTVSLWASQESAEHQKEWIDSTGCGGGCYRAHEVIRLDMQP
ncbi:hypothetical protein ACIGW1_18485 [Streptomyces sp. NPDC053780]|uniref:hypothetical protein n=1 Tax=unclassified Streptomyces TaxID=2593676 RepID=UPI00343F44B9